MKVPVIYLEFLCIYYELLRISSNLHNLFYIKVDLV